MKRPRTPISILIADDDQEDALLAQEALVEARLHNDLHFVRDGKELLAFLFREEPYTDAPRPGLILLDLNMPKVSGRQALERIKADPELRGIPVVVLTSSKAEEDIYASYDLGVAGYVTKPVTFDRLVQVMRSIGRYWLEIVELPEGQ